MGSDPSYKTYPARFISRGVTARPADDTVPDGQYLNMDNVEELTENALASRLGSIILNRTNTNVHALPDGVHSVGKLLGLNGSAWRYAGAGTSLYRRTGTTQGPYSLFTTGMSGNAWSSGTYRPTLSSYPYHFFADSARMLKDNGALVAPQQWGIFAPNQPVQAEVASPEARILDLFDDPAGDYSTVNFSSTSSNPRNATTLTSAVVLVGGAPTIATVTVADATNLLQFQFVTINAGGGNQETVLVMAFTQTGFTAEFSKAHSVGETVTSEYIGGNVATSTTASISRTGSFNLGTFPDGTLSQSQDFLSFSLIVSDPNNVQEIRVSLDVGDGSFTENFFYGVVAPSAAQSSVSMTTDPTQAYQEALFYNTLSAINNGTVDTTDSLLAPITSPYSFPTGLNVWASYQIQLGALTPVGNADINSTTGYSLANVNAWQIEVVTNTVGGVTVGMDDLAMIGGAGPDSFAGVSYDWLYTYYNAETGAESNPCMSMADVDPPVNTTFLLPRRQGVRLTLIPSSDPQVTNIRVYRRGGTLASNYFRVDQIPANATTYVDVQSDADIESADSISFVNDVPVTSTLPVPVNTVLTMGYEPPFLVGAVMTLTPASMVGISVNQQVTLGGETDENLEIVIVISTTSTTFDAFIQNPHAVGTQVTAEAFYGQPCNLMAIAYNAAWLAGDTNNPHYLYFSTNFSPESFGSANFIEVGVPSDPITAVVPWRGGLYVATRDHWYVIGPQTGATPTVYPTSAIHGVYAPFGWVTTENAIWHQAVDGIRAFSGQASEYLSQDIEFVFQGGATPLVEAQFSSLNQSVMAYWNNMVFLSYVGVDGNRHRLIYHVVYKRYRNDDVPATCLLLEEDINILIYGDANGIVHQDRVGTYDEASNAGQLVPQPISLDLQTAYMDQGAPKIQKQYNELTLDADTAGQPLTLTLTYNDGQITEVVGTLQTTGRQKQNFTLNSGLGQEAYRVSLNVTGDVLQRITLYQVDIRAVMLAETRLSMDTYTVLFGTEESKLAKQAYFDYQASSPLTCSIYYDSETTPGFTFTLPASPRRSLRIRFPAVKFRLFRLVITSASDYQMWSAKVEVKPILATKGYASFDIQANG